MTLDELISTSFLNYSQYNSSEGFKATTKKYWMINFLVPEAAASQVEMINFPPVFIFCLFN